MSNTATVVDTPEGIELYGLAVLKSALRLEALGMKKRGASALSIARSKGYKGTRATIINTITEKLAKARETEAEALKFTAEE